MNSSAPADADAAATTLKPAVPMYRQPLPRTAATSQRSSNNLREILQPPKSKSSAGGASSTTNPSAASVTTTSRSTAQQGRSSTQLPTPTSLRQSHRLSVGAAVHPASAAAAAAAASTNKNSSSTAFKAPAARRPLQPTSVPQESNYQADLPPDTQIKLQRPSKSQTPAASLQSASSKARTRATIEATAASHNMSVDEYLRKQGKYRDWFREETFYLDVYNDRDLRFLTAALSRFPVVRCLTVLIGFR